MAQSWPLFCLFSFFSQFNSNDIIQIEKSIDGVLGIWTRGHGMVGADETTELYFSVFIIQSNYIKRVLHTLVLWAKYLNEQRPTLGKEMRWKMFLLDLAILNKTLIGILPYVY